MINADLIQPHMHVLGSDDAEVAIVDHVDGNELKLTRDDNGNHHYIPIDWIRSVDDKVHIDRAGEQAKQQWRTE
jgi:hypothetical protein